MATPLTDYPLSPSGLAEAITAGDSAGAERLMEAGIDANAELPSGDTPLTLAAGLGHVVILCAIGARGAHLDHPARYHGQKQTALFRAVSHGHIECVRALIGLGCNIERGLDDDVTPLWSAAEDDHQEIVRLLLDAGADPYAHGPKYSTPLDRATRHGFAVVDLLLSAMHDPVRRREALLGAVYAAAWDENVYAVRALLDRAAEDKLGEHLSSGLLEVASIRGNVELMQFALSLGPCQLDGVCRGDQDGHTLLMACVLRGRLDAVRLLVEAGANVHARETRLGYTSVMFACYLDKPEYPQIVELLLEHGADINARTNDGRTAILIAMSSGMRGVVDVLVRRGADLSAQDRHGRNIFDLAEVRGDRYLIELVATRLH